MAKQKYYKVRHNNTTEIMSGIDIAILQQSGSKVKVKHRVYQCISCGSWNKSSTDCTHCGFDASEVDIY